MKRTSKWFCRLLACLLLTTATVHASAPVSRPWKAHGVTTLVIDLTQYLATGDPICPFFAEGTGEGTHVGRYTSGGVHTVNLLTGEITGECGMITAQREQLFFKPTPVSQDAFFYEIVSGTGPFEGVTGSFLETSVTLSDEIVVAETDSGEINVYEIVTASYIDAGTVSF